MSKQNTATSLDENNDTEHHGNKTPYLSVMSLEERMSRGSSGRT